MTDRTNQVWEEHGTVFVVVGPPTITEFYERHPVCVLSTASDGSRAEEKFVDEGAIHWEGMPYMRRLE